MPFIVNKVTPEMAGGDCYCKHCDSKTGCLWYRNAGKEPTLNRLKCLWFKSKYNKHDKNLHKSFDRADGLLKLEKFDGVGFSL